MFSRDFTTILLALLLPVLTPTAAAGGQDRLFDAKDAIRTVFWPQVYAGGGTTLWCQARFTEPGSRVTADAIYQVPWIRDATGCNARQPCENNRDFQRMTADLHNYFPAEKSVQLERRNRLFDKVPGKELEAGCQYRILGGQMEPSDAIKGEVARAILYMHAEYGLKVPGPINMFIDWHQQDPPTAEEKARNARIEAAQGNRNPFVDNPKLAEKYRAR